VGRALLARIRPGKSLSALSAALNGPLRPIELIPAEKPLGSACSWCRLFQPVPPRSVHSRRGRELPSPALRDAWTMPAASRRTRDCLDWISPGRSHRSSGQTMTAWY